jgi:hypothetical protein
MPLEKSWPILVKSLLTMACNAVAAAALVGVDQELDVVRRDGSHEKFSLRGVSLPSQVQC